MGRVIPVLLALVLVVAGCLGSTSYDTHSSSVGYSSSQTTETTATTEKCSCSPSTNFSKEITYLERRVELLNASLDECRNNATLIGYSLNVTQSRLATLTSEYSECLANLSTCNTTRLKLEDCRKELENTQSELNECKATSNRLSSELEKCRLKLNETYDALNRTYTEGSVELLIERDYYVEAIEAIDDAAEEIYVMMFSMLYDPDDWSDEANGLINALIRARRRGVEVHVLLENSLDTNREAYSYLRSNGVDVSYDSPSTTLHSKVVIVDGRIVFIGSHNWSESALHWNHEVSVKIVSRELARRLIDYFWSLRNS